MPRFVVIATVTSILAQTLEQRLALTYLHALLRHKYTSCDLVNTFYIPLQPSAALVAGDVVPRLRLLSLLAESYFGSRRRGDAR